MAKKWSLTPQLWRRAFIRHSNREASKQKCTFTYYLWYNSKLGQCPFHISISGFIYFPVHFNVFNSAREHEEIQSKSQSSPSNCGTFLRKINWNSNTKSFFFFVWKSSAKEFPINDDWGPRNLEQCYNINRAIAIHFFGGLKMLMWNTWNSEKWRQRPVIFE